MSTSRVSGLLFDDNNVNGQFDNGDSLVTKGVTVQLLDADNSVLQTTETDSDGRYEFSELSPRSYKVRFLSGSEIRLTVRLRLMTSPWSVSILKN